MFILTNVKKMTHLIVAIGLALFILSANARDYHYSDAHLHYVDFFQDTDGMNKLLKAMDKGKIDHVMISGVSVAKKWHEDEPQKPRYYAGDDAAVYWYSATDTIIVDAVKKLSKEQRKRFHPFLTGFNPVDKMAAEHIERMLEMNPGFWQGIGEIFTRHDHLTALTTGGIPRANNEALARVYNLAAKHNLPVLLHSNITSQREREPIYLAELEEAVKKHPKTRFIWAHAGTSAELHRHQKKLDFLLPQVKRLLKAYPNLYIDLSWTVLEPYLIDKDKKPDPKWVELVEEYPDRFVLGSDVVGKFDNLPSYLESFNPFLDALPEDIARKVARDNFLAILPKAINQE